MSGSTDLEVIVPAPAGGLPGRLTVPPAARGLVLFAHGSGSSRVSPRNIAVAERLNTAGLATLLFDLLLPAEAQDRRNVFDIALLADRLLVATNWVAARSAAAHPEAARPEVARPEVARLPLGYFGASTGAAAALWAAAVSAVRVRAVVSRGGRPDLAAAHLERVSAPTLLIVGGADALVLGLNQDARRLLRCESALEVVPGASHLFEEPGTLERVADLAADWFVRYLTASLRSR